jgi:hypothetical protein
MALASETKSGPILAQLADLLRLASLARLPRGSFAPLPGITASASAMTPEMTPIGLDPAGIAASHGDYYVNRKDRGEQAEDGTRHPSSARQSVVPFRILSSMARETTWPAWRRAQQGTVR